MAVIGVSDLWKIFEWANGRVSSSEADRRKRAEGWLDAVYADLKELSDIWLDIATNQRVFFRQAKRALVIVEGDQSDERHFISQAVTFTRLTEFYQATSRVLPPDNPFRETFLNSLGTLMVYRNRARGLLDRNAGAWDVSPEEVDQMKIAASDLQRQTAILQAQITNFKATR
ncbi:MAG: hypothetical protein ABSH56_13190 [Bryobacteraceae bacterium]|jgi:hypothetical protein